MYHDEFLGHSIEDCQNFLDLVQEMMDDEKIEFCEKVKGHTINVIQGETSKLVIIFY